MPVHTFSLSKTLRAALVYFALVFGVGFLLGLIRVPFVVPRIGERYAELAEMPFAIFEALNNPLPVLTLKGMGLVLAVAVFPGYGAYLAYSVMQRELGVARVGVVLYLGPIYAAVIAWLVLGEALHAYHAWAMAMVLPGIYLVNRTRTS